jgi:hypothetical protein
MTPQAPVRTMPTPPSIGLSSKFEVTLRLAVSQSICLGIENPCWTCNQILLPVRMLLSEIWGPVSVGHPLWRDDGSAICSVNTQWSESRRTRYHTLLSLLRLPQPGTPGSRIYIPPGNRVAQLYPQALGSLQVISYDSPNTTPYVASAQAHRKHGFPKYIPIYYCYMNQDWTGATWKHWIMCCYSVVP